MEDDKFKTLFPVASERYVGVIRFSLSGRNRKLFTFL